MSGIVNNTKVTYTYWNGENLASLPLSADNENIGQIRSLLNALTDNKNSHSVNEGLKELSYIYYDDRDYDTDDETERAAANMSRPYGGQLFYNILKFTKTASEVDGTEYVTTINVNFAAIFEGCSQERFINVTQVDAQIYPTNDDAYFYIEGTNIKTTTSQDANPADTAFTGVYFDTCTLWYHRYKTSDDSIFDPEDTQLVKNQIMTKTFRIPSGQGFIDDRVLVNFPVKMMFMMFRDDNGDFSELLDVRFKRISLNIAGEQKRIINVDNENTPNRIDHTFFEWMDYLCNSRSDEYDTLLTYQTWLNQFRIFAFPLAEWFPMRASNQIQFEIELEEKVAATIQMNLIMIRANVVNA